MQGYPFALNNVKRREDVHRISLLIRLGVSIKNNLKELDLSYKTDLDF